MEANNTQRRELTRMFQQLLMQNPMVKKLGGATQALLLEAVRFQFGELPVKGKKFVKKLEVVGAGEEEEREQFIRFTFTWKHPCLDYSITIQKDFQSTHFENIL